MPERKLGITYVELPALAARTITYETGKEAKLDYTGVLESLAVFYDEVFIPFQYGHDRAGPVLMTFSGGNLEAVNEALSSEFDAWRQTWKTALSQGVVQILPPPIQEFTDLPMELRGQLIRSVRKPDGTFDFFELALNLPMIVHALRGTSPAPEFRLGSAEEEALPGLVIASLATCIVPRVRQLNGEQILELREHLRDVRDGFRYYVCELLDEVEKRIKEGKHVQQAVEQIVTRKVEPRFREFQRQLAAKKVGKWSKYFAPVTEFLKIDAAPWTPRFYGEVLKVVFGIGAEFGRAEEEARTNASQAFQCLGRLEDYVALED